MGEDGPIDPDSLTAARERMGTREFDLEEQRGAREERTTMLAGFATEKADMLGSFERSNKGKNYIIYMLIAANLFQAAMLLGQNLDFKGAGIEVSTGEGAEDAGRPD